MFGNHYNQSIRKLVIAFGNLFNEIYIRKYKENQTYDKIRVPLTYSPKEKFYRRIKEQSSISANTRVEITLPRISFSMKTIEYDPTRKTSKINRRSFITPDGTVSSRDGVPYNISFELSSFTRSIDENLQIVEQIIPYFSPEYNLRINFNEVFQNVTVPIVFGQVNMVEDYEGTFEERRILINTYTFTAKTFIYGPVYESGLIEDINLDLYSMFNPDIPLVGIGITGDASTGTSGPINVIYY